MTLKRVFIRLLWTQIPQCHCLSVSNPADGVVSLTVDVDCVIYAPVVHGGGGGAEPWSSRV